MMADKSQERPRREILSNQDKDFIYQNKETLKQSPNDDLSQVCECDTCASIVNLPKCFAVDFTTVSVESDGKLCYRKIPCDIKSKVDPHIMLKALQSYHESVGTYRPD